MFEGEGLNVAIEVDWVESIFWFRLRYQNGSVGPPRLVALYAQYT